MNKHPTSTECFHFGRITFKKQQNYQVYHITELYVNLYADLPCFLMHASLLASWNNLKPVLSFRLFSSSTLRGIESINFSAFSTSLGLLVFGCSLGRGLSHDSRLRFLLVALVLTVLTLSLFSHNLVEKFSLSWLLFFINLEQAVVASFQTTRMDFCGLKKQRSFFVTFSANSLKFLRPEKRIG